MTLTHEIYDELSNSSVSDKSLISKLYYLDENNYVVYALSQKEKRRHFYFLINDTNTENIPQFNGISLEIVQLREFSSSDFFCDIAQSINSENYIYETIIEDIRVQLEKKKYEPLVSVIILCMRKWQNFFARNKEILMSPERQQGLYGELKFLKELINITDSKSVNFWSGCKYETHDFYIKNNAFEVKTTTTKSPYKMRISSEYQLDPSNVNGDIYIRFFALRKSESDGEKLSELIYKIRELIKNDPYSLDKFNEDLEEYGYFDAVSEKYNTGYTERESLLFKTGNDFPRIIKSDLINGVSNCIYDISVDCCRSFQVESEILLKKIMEGDYVR